MPRYRGIRLIDSLSNRYTRAGIWRMSLAAGQSRCVDPHAMELLTECSWSN